MKMDTPRVHRVTEWKPYARGRLLSCELLAREAPEAPQIMKAIATAVGCIPALDGKILLMKTIHVYTMTTGMEK